MNITRSVDRGFSLIELMITLAVAGILIAIGIPSLKTFVASNRLSSNVNTMVGLINFARSEAIVRNQPVVICPTSSSGSACQNSANWEQYSIQVFVDLDGNGNFNGSDILLKSISAIDASGNISRITRQGGAGVITFRSSGLSSVAQGFDIYEVNSADAAYQFKYGRSVCLSISGRSRVSPYTTNICNNF